jgi:hypothetical protein
MTDTRVFTLDARDDIIITGSYQVSFEGGRLGGYCGYGPAVYDINEAEGAASGH